MDLACRQRQSSVWPVPPGAGPLCSAARYRVVWLVTVLALAASHCPAQDPGAGSEAPKPAKSAVLSALRAWGVPDDTWALLSPEVAQRLVDERPTGLLMESPELLERLGCSVVQGASGRCLVAGGLSRLDPARAWRARGRVQDLARVCDAVPDVLRSWFAAGAWIRADQLDQGGREALRRYTSRSPSGPDDPDPDSPNSFVRIWVRTVCEIGGDPGSTEARRTVLRSAPSSAAPALVAVATDGAGPTVCVSVRCSAAVAARAAELPPGGLGAVGELAKSLAPGPDVLSGGASLLVEADSANGLGGGSATVWTLAEWADRVRPLCRGVELVVDESDTGTLIVIPAACRSWSAAASALSEPGRLTVRHIGDLLFVTCSRDTSDRGAATATERANERFAQALASRVLDAQWPILHASLLPADDRDALVGLRGTSKLSAAVAAIVWASPPARATESGYSSGAVRLLDASGHAVQGGAAPQQAPPDGLVARGETTVYLGVAEVLRYVGGVAAGARLSAVQAPRPEVAHQPLFTIGRIREVGISASRLRPGTEAR